ncbi:MAG: PAS domain-containing protein [Gemmatimonadaceae bacterium]
MTDIVSPLSSARHALASDIARTVAADGGTSRHIARLLRLVLDASRASALRLSLYGDPSSDELVDVTSIGHQGLRGRELTIELREGKGGRLGKLTLTRPPGELWLGEDWVRSENWAQAIVRELLLTARDDVVAETGARGARPRNDQLVSAIEGSDDGMILISADRHVEWINDGFLRMIELPRAAVQGATLQQLQRAHPTIGALRDLDASCEMGLDTSYERVRGRHSGERFWISVAFTVVRNDAEEVTHFVAIARDVTGQREREFKLRRLSSALHASTEGIAVVDDARRFTVANLAFARLHGLDSAEEVLGRSWFDVCAPFAGLDRLHDVEFAIETSSAWMGQFEMSGPTGTSRIVRHAVTRLLDGGWIISACAITQ